MAGTTRALIQLLLILFVFDIVRKIYFKPKEKLNSSKINQNSLINNNKNQLEKKSKKNVSQMNKENYEDDNDNDNEFVLEKNTEKNNEQNNETIPDKTKKSQKKKTILIYYDKYLYDKNFMKLKNEIENNFTNIIVEGEEYPLPENKKIFLKFTYVTQIGLSLLLIFTKSLKLGLPFLSDNIIKMIEDYKWVIIISNFIIHFWLNKYLATTGAFEIMCNKKLVYSKLEKHILPKELDIKNIINNLHIKPKEIKDDDF